MVFERIGRSLGFGGKSKEDAPPQESSSGPAPPPSMPTDQGMPASDAPTMTEAPIEETAPAMESQPEMAATMSDAPPQETYTVQSGDTLSAIAQRHYGDAGQYMRIFEANRDKLENPDMIHPGQELIIPRQ